MSFDFRLRDFAYPLSILSLKRAFLRHERQTSKEVEQYQLARLQTVVAHAYQHIPYYRRLLDESGLKAGNIQDIGELSALPLLTKDILRKSLQDLTADNAQAFKPQLHTTSGTTGEPVRFYLDKCANVLEFVYYWRAWGWAGYRLGHRFAELSAEYFTSDKRQRRNTLYHYEPLTRRLILNSLLLSRHYRDDYLEILTRYKPLFLKGLPTNLHVFALLLGEKKNHGLPLRAVFSQGESLRPSYREVIEQSFQCKVFDSYGHLERTVAISQCTEGKYHVHPDYGLIEFQPVEWDSNDEHAAGVTLAEVIGTSLHNFAMPLIRYRTGDLVELESDPQPCLCGRKFPTVRAVIGRKCDVVITPDKRAVTALYIAFDRTPGLLLGQIVQEGLSDLTVKFACRPEDEEEVTNCLVRNVRDFVGSEMRIRPLRIDLDELRRAGRGKFKNVISRVPLEL